MTDFILSNTEVDLIRESKDPVFRKWKYNVP